MKKRVLIAPAVLSLGIITAAATATSVSADPTSGVVSQSDPGSQVTVPGADPTQQAPTDNGDGLTAGEPSQKSTPTTTPTDSAETDDDSATADQVSQVTSATDRSWYSGTETSEGVKVTFSGLVKGKTYYASTAPGPTALDSTNPVAFSAVSGSQTVTFKPHGAGIIGGVNRIFIDNPDGSRHDVGSFAVNDALAQPSFSLSTSNLRTADLASTGISITGKSALGSDANLVVNLQEHTGPDTQQRDPESVGGTSITADGSGNVSGNLKVSSVTPGQYDLFVYNDAGTIVYEQVVTVTAQ